MCDNHTAACTFASFVLLSHYLFPQSFLFIMFSLLIDQYIDFDFIKISSRLSFLCSELLSLFSKLSKSIRINHQLELIKCDVENTPVIFPLFSRKSGRFRTWIRKLPMKRIVSIKLCGLAFFTLKCSVCVYWKVLFWALVMLWRLCSNWGAFVREKPAIMIMKIDLRKVVIAPGACFDSLVFLATASHL